MAAKMRFLGRFAYAFGPRFDAAESWGPIDRIRQSVSPPGGNNSNAEAFAPHENTSASFDLGNSDGIQRGNRAGSAYASDATGSNGPASAREECDGLRADAIDAATRYHRAAGHHDHRLPSGAAQRQTGEIRRRALPARRSWPGNSRTDAWDGQYAGHSSARQPWRRSDDPAEINPALRRPHDEGTSSRICAYSTWMRKVLTGAESHVLCCILIRNMYLIAPGGRSRAIYRTPNESLAGPISRWGNALQNNRTNQDQRPLRLEALF
jgi:hypothetical protein